MRCHHARPEEKLHPRLLEASAEESTATVCGGWRSRQRRRLPVHFGTRTWVQRCRSAWPCSRTSAGRSAWPRSRPTASVVLLYCSDFSSCKCIRSHLLLPQFIVRRLASRLMAPLHLRAWPRRQPKPLDPPAASLRSTGRQELGPHGKPPRIWRQLPERQVSLSTTSRVPGVVLA